MAEGFDGGAHDLCVVGGGEDRDQSGDDVVDVFGVAVDEVTQAAGFEDELVRWLVGGHGVSVSEERWCRRGT